MTRARSSAAWRTGTSSSACVTAAAPTARRAWATASCTRTTRPRSTATNDPKRSDLHRSGRLILTSVTCRSLPARIVDFRVRTCKSRLTRTNVSVIVCRLKLLFSNNPPPPAQYSVRNHPANYLCRTNSIRGYLLQG
ncbi:MAG: hypothetical protein UT32_C0002G0083 [Parcubacteria group bacterium GW2011_GWC2_39_14]|nr:MAG: hypothetical protein UT32_C0002G0083 [Parcubacteria group bacterium GW2011_GWC2_39_14]KKR55308.1 MAG: hypothetical protein UT91_C0003G0083 [Parcubacteria group bacterium GW2011_GWA2_40_23]